MVFGWNLASVRWAVARDSVKALMRDGHMPRLHLPDGFAGGVSAESNPLCVGVRESTFTS